MITFCSILDFPPLICVGCLTSDWCLSLLTSSPSDSWCSSRTGVPPPSSAGHTTGQKHTAVNTKNLQRDNSWKRVELLQSDFSWMTGVILPHLPAGLGLTWFSSRLAGLLHNSPTGTPVLWCFQRELHLIERFRTSTVHIKLHSKC